MAQVELHDITKAFGATPVLRGLSLAIAAGELVSILGASGCGKTTLLRIIAGLEAVSGGRVIIGGRDVTAVAPEDRDIAMMFQSYALLPHLTVAENVRFPLRMRRRGGRREQDDAVKRALETVRLADLADRKPRQLSGGQQQRVALARAIVSQPQVLLLDEPLSNLDARLREDMQVELIDIHRRTGLTTILVTHDQDEALSLSDRVVLMNAGRIEQVGAPGEIYRHPATGFASSFLGSANLLPVQVDATRDGPVAQLADGQSVALAQGEARRGAATLVLRQEAVMLSRPDARPGPALRGQVEARVYLGSRTRYVVSIAGTRIRVLTTSDVRFERGEPVAIAIPPGDLRLVDAGS